MGGRNKASPAGNLSCFSSFQKKFFNGAAVYFDGGAVNINGGAVKINSGAVKKNRSRVYKLFLTSGNMCERIKKVRPSGFKRTALIHNPDARNNESEVVI